MGTHPIRAVRVQGFSCQNSEVRPTESSTRCDSSIVRGFHAGLRGSRYHAFARCHVLVAMNAFRFDACRFVRDNRYAEHVPRTIREPFRGANYGVIGFARRERSRHPDLTGHGMNVDRFPNFHPCQHALHVGDVDAETTRDDRRSRWESVREQMFVDEDPHCFRIQRILRPISFVHTCLNRF